MYSYQLKSVSRILITEQSYGLILLKLLATILLANKNNIFEFRLKRNLTLSDVHAINP